MKYCLDISAVPYGTGVARYTANLARAIVKVKDQADDFRLFGTSFRQYAALRSFVASLNSPSHLLYRLPPTLTTRVFHQFNIPVDMIIPGTHVFHTWDWYLPRSTKVATVITVHDLALFRYPDIAHPDIKAHHEAVLKRIKRYRPHIIAVSEATKNDLIELFHIDPADITVVYEALPEESCVSPQPVDTGSDKPYFLMVGTLEPRKNLARQIEAWRPYKNDYNLVIVGKAGWDMVKPEPGLIHIGYAAGGKLAGLYGGASLLLYASLAEGFGLPILEAFYHHLPVVTSNGSSLSEIAGDAAAQVDPLSVDSIREGVRCALEKSSELITLGNQRLNHFSWTNTATATLDVYRQAAESRG